VSAPAPPTAPAPAAPRWPAIDVLRGLAMVLMALDHTRDFWSNARYDPLDLTQTSIALYLTRWVTHLCAPVFMLLAGAGAAMSLGRGRDRAGLARYLVSRGLWLVVLELTLIDVCWKGASADGVHVRAMVIWALGWSMVALAGLQYLPRWALVGFGAALVIGHNALDGVSAAALGPFDWAWTILHAPGLIGAQDHGPSLFVLYPLVPWIGVMALGYALGAWLSAPAWRDDPRRRARALVGLGLALLAVFGVLRAIDIYGEPEPWTAQATASLTALSFLDVTKYPPSLDYLLVTGGLALLLLAAFDRARGRLVEALRVLGRVPLFFYVVHLMLLGRARDLAYWLELGRWPVRGEPSTFGVGLLGVHGVWLVALIAIYPLCRWFAGVKARHPRGWLSYC
jgi:uncharacterized membrane protein